MADLIAPSILSADFARLGEEVDNVLKAGADIVHFDVMDNHFVPNLTIGPLVCEALRKHGVTAPIDVHLMVDPVDRIIPDFAKAGATTSLSTQASRHIDRSLQMIRDHGCKSGLVFNPATPLSYLEHVLDKADMILLMSVNLGFGGQSFLPSALPNCVKPDKSSMTAVSTFAWKSTASTPPTSVRSKPPALTPSSRAPQSSANPITKPSSTKMRAEMAKA